MAHFIHIFFVIYHFIFSHAITTTTHLPSLYNSYYFNLNNASQWFTNSSHPTISCTSQIPSLCIEYNPSKSQPTFNILYKHIPFNFIKPSHTITNTFKPRRRLRSRHCPNILYSRRHRTRPRRGHRIRNINFEDNMIFSMEIQVLGWPRHTWANILHCGNRNTIRQPAIWINKHGKYFHIVYGTRRNWNQLKNYHRIRLGRKYKIEWRIRRNGYTVYVNNRRFYNVRGRHHNYRNMPCWLSDPWYSAANVYVTNLKIIRGTDPSGGCRRRRRRRRRRWRRPKIRRRPIESIASYYKKLHKIGKQIGKILNHGDRVGEYNSRRRNNGVVGGWVIGWPAPAGYGESESFLSGMSPGKPIQSYWRRLMDENSGNGMDEMNENGLYMKKCVVVDGINEICVVYFYENGSMGLEYNVRENGSDGMEGYMNVDDVDRNAYVWNWNVDDGNGCNKGLLDVVGFVICVEGNGGSDMGMVVKDGNGMEVKKMDLRSDGEWDKVYRMRNDNEMNVEKRMCKFVGESEICVDVMNSYERLQFIVQDVDRNIVEK